VARTCPERSRMGPSPAKSLRFPRTVPPIQYLQGFVGSLASGAASSCGIFDPPCPSQKKRSLPAYAAKPPELPAYGPVSATTARYSAFRLAMKPSSRPTSAWKESTFAASGIHRNQLAIAAWPAASAISPPWEGSPSPLFYRWPYHESSRRSGLIALCAACWLSLRILASLSRVEIRQNRLPASWLTLLFWDRCPRAPRFCARARVRGIVFTSAERSAARRRPCSA
jgi:hypothetical protein